MSQAFNIKRFGRMLTYDLRRCSVLRWRGMGSMGANMLVIMLLPLICVLTQFIIGTHVFCMVPERWFFIILCGMLVMVLTPEMLYGKINREEGIHYAMLPATKLEKYLSMLVMTLVVCPLTTICGMFVVDTLATFLPFHVYDQYLWQSLAPLEGFGFHPVEHFGWPQFWHLMAIILGFLMAGMAFTLGNTLFLKNKTVMTILCCFGFGFVVSVILTSFHGSIMPTDVADRNAYIAGSVISGSIIGWFFRIGVLMQVVLITVFTALSWDKIKKMGY